MFNLETLVDVVALVAASKRERAVLWQDASGNWHPISSDELLSRVYTLANAFRSWGIVKGDRIALLAENRWEWPVVDFATLVLGAVDVPIYPTLTAEQIAVLLIDSGARVAVVSTESQYQKIASIRSQTQLEHIIVMDEIADLESRRGHRSPLCSRVPPLPRSICNSGCAVSRSSRKIWPPLSIPQAPPVSPRASCSPTATSPPT